MSVFNKTNDALIVDTFGRRLNVNLILLTTSTYVYFT